VPTTEANRDSHNNRKSGICSGDVGSVMPQQ
jgi:hypothetical protein